MDSSNCAEVDPVTSSYITYIANEGYVTKLDL